MIQEIPTVSRFSARVRVPGSKSITNRALVCAALARGESVLTGASDSEDTGLMANGLDLLGVLVRPSPRGLVVDGTGGLLTAPRFPIPVGNAGTTLRFLLSVAGLAQGDVVFEGHARMAKRPNDDLLAALEGLGVHATTDSSIPQFMVRGGTLRGGKVQVRADKSSQFLSSVLLVSPYAEEGVTIVLDGGRLASAPYVEMTISVMEAFGVRVRRPEPHVFLVEKGQRYTPREYEVESDASSASYFLAAAAVTGGEATVEGISGASLQGDAQFARVLSRMGCQVEDDGKAITVRGPQRLRGVEADMNSMPDMVPTLVAAALFADGPTNVSNVAHLRFKESDRLGTLAAELARLGGDIVVREDGLTVTPCPLKGTSVDPHDDHRLAMMFAVIGLRVRGIGVARPECVRKSFPGFWPAFLDAAGDSGNRLNKKG